MYNYIYNNKHMCSMKHVTSDLMSEAWVANKMVNDNKYQPTIIPTFNPQ